MQDYKHDLYVTACILRGLRVFEVVAFIGIICGFVALLTRGGIKLLVLSVAVRILLIPFHIYTVNVKHDLEAQIKAEETARKMA